MLTLLVPCESPKRSVWHLVSGVTVLSAAWAALVVFVQIWNR